MNREEQIKYLKEQLDLICIKKNILSYDVIYLSQKLDELIVVEQKNRLDKIFKD
ncbi:Spo0E family sporulation regulatory protein-aspartic acid phosphatase [Faecalimicrobium sp. JNUCC 81]